MSKLNPKTKIDPTRLAGGWGAKAATQSAEAELRRLVMANLLWEDLAYVDGVSIAEAIAEIMPQVAPLVVREIVLAARFEQKLRHTPLLLMRLMAKLAGYREHLGTLIPEVCTRADMITDFLALYWKDGRQPLAAQVKKGLAAAIANFDEYALAKYDRAGAVKLRDVLFLVHGKPPAGKEDLYAKLASRQLKTPDTWEVALSAGSNKQESWDRLIAENKLGALAFLRNLRNFELAEVSSTRIEQGFRQIKSEYLLPINFLAAAAAAPNWLRQIEDLMFRSLTKAPKLNGHTVLVLDVSGSMQSRLSNKSSFSRLDVAAVMGMFAAEQCDRISVYVTAGSDQKRIHQTERLSPYRGFALADKVRESLSRMGGGGIFTRQCLEFIRQQERERPDRIVVFSDSQDCDLANKKPQPFGCRNYIIDISAHQHGINYQGVWTAEISGWSEHFLTYIAAIESAAN